MPHSRSSEETAALVASNARHHMPVLDGLRGLAIIVVLAHNVGLVQTHAPTHWHKLLFPIHLEGWIGVHLFFVLSGFLITGILLDTKDRASSSHYFRSFYVRRTLRIFPLYYAALLVAFILAPWLFPRIAPSTPASLQLWYWTYLENWGSPYGHEVPLFSHFWSLAVEEQFYLVWPLVVILASRRALAWVSGALALAALLTRVWLVTHHAPMFAPYQFTTARMDALVLGGAAALLVRAPASMTRALPWLGRGTVLFALCILAMAPFTGGFVAHVPPTQMFGHSLLAFFFTFLLLFAVANEARGGRASRWLGHPALQWVGRYSYAIYVVHAPIAIALRPTFEPLVLSPSFPLAACALIGYIALVFALSTAAALVTWHLFEKRCLALKDVLAPRAETRVAVSRGVSTNADRRS